MLVLFLYPANYFNPRTSCEVRRFGKSCETKQTHISIHAPRVRCDRRCQLKRSEEDYFNPRTSCEVRRAGKVGKRMEIKISIHAPRVRCDAFRLTVGMSI